MNVIDELRWYFQHASFDQEQEFTQATTRERLADRVDFVGGPNFNARASTMDSTRLARKIRAAMATIPEAHYRVLGAAFEQKVYPPQVVNVLGKWASVAIRTRSIRHSLDANEADMVPQWWQAPSPRWPGVLPADAVTVQPAPELVEIVSGDHDSHAGVMGFARELKATSHAAAMARTEGAALLAMALDSYRMARGFGGGPTGGGLVAA